MDFVPGASSRYGHRSFPKDVTSPIFKLAPTAWRRRADEGGLEARQSVPVHLA
jgi:hypothetical protein